ncbi:hypothetical protein AB834_04860 [PVC group bacterium (ex Bugula neritina AB1)]|nr:hypothetical protein AB834_04860 [PVC group bacterium (ex Bugula neritina AB1)]
MRFVALFLVQIIFLSFLNVSPLKSLALSSSLPLDGQNFLRNNSTENVLKNQEQLSINLSESISEKRVSFSSFLKKVTLLFFTLFFMLSFAVAGALLVFFPSIWAFFPNYLPIPFCVAIALSFSFFFLFLTQYVLYRYEVNDLKREDSNHPIPLFISMGLIFLCPVIFHLMSQFYANYLILTWLEIFLGFLVCFLFYLQRRLYCLRKNLKNSEKTEVKTTRLSKIIKFKIILMSGGLFVLLFGFFSSTAYFIFASSKVFLEVHHLFIILSAVGTFLVACIFIFDTLFLLWKRKKPTQKEKKYRAMTLCYILSFLFVVASVFLTVIWIVFFDNIYVKRFCPITISFLVFAIFFLRCITWNMFYKKNETQKISCDSYDHSDEEAREEECDEDEQGSHTSINSLFIEEDSRSLRDMLLFSVSINDILKGASTSKRVGELSRISDSQSNMSLRLAPVKLTSLNKNNQEHLCSTCFINISENKKRIVEDDSGSLISTYDNNPFFENSRTGIDSSNPFGESPGVVESSNAINPFDGSLLKPLSGDLSLNLDLLMHEYKGAYQRVKASKLNPKKFTKQFYMRKLRWIKEETYLKEVVDLFKRVVYLNEKQSTMEDLVPFLERKLTPLKKKIDELKCTFNLEQCALGTIFFAHLILCQRFVTDKYFTNQSLYILSLCCLLKMIYKKNWEKLFPFLQEILKKFFDKDWNEAFEYLVHDENLRKNIRKINKQEKLVRKINKLRLKHGLSA